MSRVFIGRGYGMDTHNSTEWKRLCAQVCVSISALRRQSCARPGQRLRPLRVLRWRRLSGWLLPYRLQWACSKFAWVKPRAVVTAYVCRCPDRICYLDTPAQALAVALFSGRPGISACLALGESAGPNRFKALRAGLQEDRYRLVSQLKEANTDPDGTVCPGCEVLIQCWPLIRCSPARAWGLWVCSVTPCPLARDKEGRNSGNRYERHCASALGRSVGRVRVCCVPSACTRFGRLPRSHFKLLARDPPLRRWVNRDIVNETFRPRTRSRVCKISSRLLLAADDML